MQGGGDRGEREEGGQELLLVVAKLLVQNDCKMELVLFSQVRLILLGEEQRILSTLTLRRQVSMFAKLVRVTSKIQSSKHHSITQEGPLIVELETVRISWEGTLSARCHTLPWRAVAGWTESPAG